MNKVLPELNKFIIDFCNKYKIKSKNLDIITLSTNLEIDLNIFDIDMDLFLTEFVEKFNVDYSEFKWEKYKYPKGATLYYMVSNLLGVNSKLARKARNKNSYSKFKVKDLQDAILLGKLE